MPTVFICGPKEDLTEERKAVIYALDRLGLQHNCMEFFGARAESTLETSLSQVRQSDILIVILGDKYGSFLPNMNRSYSEAEYEESYRQQIPCLVYLRDESIPVRPNQTERDPIKAQALKRFKDHLKARHTVAFFKDSLELAVGVTVDLIRQIEVISKVQTETPGKAEATKLTPLRTTPRKIWELTMYHDQSVDSPYHQLGHMPWAEEVEEATNGRVKITICPQQQGIIKPIDAWEGIKSGTVEVAWIFGGYFPHKFDLLSSVTLPFIVPSGQIGSRVAWNLYLRFYEIQAQMSDAKILTICTSEPYLFLARDKQVRTLEDVRGMKIRAAPGPSCDLVTLMGGAPVMVPMSETYLALQKSVIDGVLLPTLPILEFRLFEVAQHYTYAPITCAYFILAMNKDVWDEMPVDIQQAIMDVSGEKQAKRYGGDLFDTARRDLPRVVESAGYPAIEYCVPQAEVDRWVGLAGRPVWNSWVNRMHGKGHKIASKILEAAIHMAKRINK